MFMMQGVLYIIVIIGLLGWPSSVYLLQQVRRMPLTGSQEMLMVSCFGGAIALSLAIWIASMRSGVRALQSMSD